MNPKPQLRQHGFTLLEVMIILGIIAILALVAIPNFLRARRESAKTACIVNLRQMDAAKHQWALENKKGNSATPSDPEIFGSNMYIPTKPSCPANGSYDLGTVGGNATCSEAEALGHAF